MARLAVLASGAGTILEAIIAAKLPVELVLTDRPCRALNIATRAGITAIHLDRRQFGYPAAGWDREGFTHALATKLQARSIGLVAMAGFMTVLTPAIFDQFPERILNTHPSLLPKFKGAHAVADALAAHAKETGCTVHIATSELDRGRILTQQRVPILPGDTSETLHERIKAVERKLYPATIFEYMGELSPLSQPKG
jgi:phosphoribosylglycinamide formyltransferase-1